MQAEQKYGKLVAANGKLFCPICKRGVLLHGITPETVVHGLPCKCKRCGQITSVEIENHNAPEPASAETSA